MHTFWRFTYQSTRVTTFFKNSYRFGFWQLLRTKLNRFLWNVSFNNGSFQTTLILHISLQNLHVSFNWIHPSHINWSTQSDFSYKMKNQMYHDIKKGWRKKHLELTQDNNNFFFKFIQLLRVNLFTTYRIEKWTKSSDCVPKFFW